MAERSGDTAFRDVAQLPKAAWRFASRRTPHPVAAAQAALCPSVSICGWFLPGCGPVPALSPGIYLALGWLDPPRTREGERPREPKHFREALENRARADARPPERPPE